MIRIRLVFWPSSGSSGDFGNPIWLLVAVVAAIGVIAAWLHPSNKDYLSTQTDLNRPQCIKDLKRQDGNETAGTRCNGTITNRGSETREYVVALTYRSSDDEQHYVEEVDYPAVVGAAPGKTTSWEAELYGKVAVQSVSLYAYLPACKEGCITHDEMLEEAKAYKPPKTDLKPWRCSTDAQLAMRTCTRKQTIYP